MSHDLTYHKKIIKKPKDGVVSGTIFIPPSFLVFWKAYASGLRRFPWKISVKKTCLTFTHGANPTYVYNVHGFFDRVGGFANLFDELLTTTSILASCLYNQSTYKLLHENYFTKAPPERICQLWKQLVEERKGKKNNFELFS